MSIRKAPIGIVVFILLAAAILLGMPDKGQVQASSVSQIERYITVTGFGSAVGAPDIAHMTLGVDSSDPDITVALNDNNQRIDAVKAALLDNGVAAEDIRTEYFNIYQDKGFAPETSGPSGEPQSFYRITHVMNVTVRNVDRMAELLGVAVEAGANTVHSINFNIADRSSLETEARINALDDARARARQLADELGVELGEVMSVTEQSGFYGSMPYGGGEGFGGASSAPPISQGTLTVSIALEVSFAIN